MAFKDVNEKLECVKTSEMEVGSSVEGYVVGFQEGQYGTNIRMQVDGQVKLVFSSGSLRWAVKDNKIKLGLLTRITRLQDEKKKGPRGIITTTKFKVEQDSEDSVAVDTVSSAVATTSTAADEMKAKVAALQQARK